MQSKVQYVSTQVLTLMSMPFQAACATHGLTLLTSDDVPKLTKKQHHTLQAVSIYPYRHTKQLQAPVVCQSINLPSQTQRSCK